MFIVLSSSLNRWDVFVLRKRLAACLAGVLRHLHSNILFSPHFESAIVQVMRGEILSQLEEAAVFERLDGRSVVAERTPDFAEELLRNSQKSSKNEDLSWISLSSNKLERFFSEAKYFLGSYRNGVLPQNLESQFFLHMNKCVWSVETIQKMLNAGRYAVKRLILSLIYIRCI